MRRFAVLFRFEGKVELFGAMVDAPTLEDAIKAYEKHRGTAGPMPKLAVVIEVTQGQGPALAALRAVEWSKITHIDPAQEGEPRPCTDCSDGECWPPSALTLYFLEPRSKISKPELAELCPRHAEYALEKSGEMIGNYQIPMARLCVKDEHGKILIWARSSADMRPLPAGTEDKRTK